MHCSQKTAVNLLLQKVVPLDKCQMPLPVLLTHWIHATARYSERVCLVGIFQFFLCCQVPFPPFKLFLVKESLTACPHIFLCLPLGLLPSSFVSQVILTSLVSCILLMWLYHIRGLLDFKRIIYCFYFVCPLYNCAIKPCTQSNSYRHSWIAFTVIGLLEWSTNTVSSLVVVVKT